LGKIPSVPSLGHHDGVDGSLPASPSSIAHPL
jgi:hypothetical protein